MAEASESFKHGKPVQTHLIGDFESSLDVFLPFKVHEYVWQSILNAWSRAKVRHVHCQQSIGIAAILKKKAVQSTICAPLKRCVNSQSKRG